MYSLSRGTKNPNAARVRRGVDVADTAGAPIAAVTTAEATTSDRPRRASFVRIVICFPRLARAEPVPCASTVALTGRVAHPCDYRTLYPWPPQWDRIVACV